MGVAPDPARPLSAPADVARRVEEMYTAHVRLVRSICRSLLRDRNEAEDAVQQTFLSAQRALANGSTPREPAAWLAVIARNECLARVRERMREPLPVDAEPTEFGMDAYSSAVSRYEVATLREALADLPRAQREAILLRELRGLSYDEVARALSVTTGAVESLIFRARRTLQVKLSEAVPALSPVALFARMFGGAGGGDLAGPAVAKIAAIGVGAALLAGGAALGPRALGLGHGGSSSHNAAPVASAPAGDKTSSRLSAQLLSTPAFVADTKSEGEAGSKDATGSSDGRESTGSDNSGSDGTSSDTSGGTDTSSSDTPNSDNSHSDTSGSDTSTTESDTTTSPASTVPTTPQTDTTTTTDTSTDPTETTDTNP